MVDILPIRHLTDEDSLIFGSLQINLGKLSRSGLQIGTGIVVTAPNLKLRTILEHFDVLSNSGKKEIFEQSLILVRKEISSIEVPQILSKEAGKHNNFFVNGVKIKSIKELWRYLLNGWIDQIKERLWKEGFQKGLTENLDPQIVIFAKKIRAWGNGYFDSLLSDTVINVRLGKLAPNELKKLDELVKNANKKLFIPHQYEWILDEDVKITKILPLPSHYFSETLPPGQIHYKEEKENKQVFKSAVKVFLDFSQGLVVEKEVDGVYIASEKIFDLNKPEASFENLVFKLVESSMTFPKYPVFCKLADKSEGMGRVRGALRLLHQKSLFDPLVSALDFVRHKKGLTNIHMVVPFVRSVQEFLQIKRELAVKKLSRKASLQLWMEAAVPENILNLGNYLIEGLDGIVLNLDELIGFLGGFDKEEGELIFYKNEVESLLNFLEEGLKLLNKSKIPFIAFGSLALNPKVLDFLVGKGVHGMIVERYEAQSSYSLLSQAEKRLILGKSQ